MTSPTEDEARLVIGAVEEVSPGRIVIALELDAPHATALIAGHPISFPRIGGFVIIPTEVGRVVAVVTWIGIERASYPKRPGLKDFGLIDLPFPLRRMALTPLGTLGGGATRLERGVSVFPSVGDPARLPTPGETLALVQAESPDDRVEIGRSVVARTATVTVDPNRLFGRHLAVLGNTGSGKSCSVAGVIRWSLDAAEQASGRSARARFIVLDPNGEYRRAFDGLSTPTRVLQVPPPDAPAGALKVPAWFWNSHEWVSFVQAAPGAQRPVLLHALRDLRAGGTTEVDIAAKLARNLHGFRAMLRSAVQGGPEVFAHWRGALDCKRALAGVVAASSDYESALDAVTKASVDAATAAAQSLFDSKDQYEVFTQLELETVIAALDDAYDALPEIRSPPGASEDAPIPFVVEDLLDHIEFLAEVHPSFSDTARYLGSLTMRISSLLGDPRIRDVIGADANEPLDSWLDGFLGGEEGAITVVDLSLVPSEIVQLVTGVIARILFEALRRHHRRRGEALPTVIVLEEAHNFVARRRAPDEGIGTPQDHCVATFERIAREGRKFGCSLVISSQRPAELSETVLAQCNTFLLHRLVNDRDQQLVRRLVPDALGGLLDELPALPARHAVLLGWATTLPTLVEIRELEAEFRPHAADPGYWESWTADEPPDVAWGALVADWAQLDDGDLEGTSASRDPNEAADPVGSHTEGASDTPDGRSQ